MLLMLPNYIHEKVETLFKVIFKHFLISFDVSNQFTTSMKTGAPIRLRKVRLPHFVCGRFCSKEQRVAKWRSRVTPERLAAGGTNAQLPSLNSALAHWVPVLFSTLGGAGAITIYSGTPRSFQT